MEILETSELNLELSEEGIGKEGHGSKEIERNVWSGVERVPPAQNGYKYKVIQIPIKSHTNKNANKNRSQRRRMFGQDRTCSVHSGYRYKVTNLDSLNSSQEIKADIKPLDHS